MGPLTTLCPEMFSINFWHQWKMGMLFSPPPTVRKELTGAFGEGTRTSLNLPRYNSDRCSASLPPPPSFSPSALRPSFSPGYIKEKQCGIGFNCLDHRCDSHRNACAATACLGLCGTQRTLTTSKFQ